ncbi:MAG TPA: Gfo/Idh/MocA family oxidoreductase [Fimbriimonas sp.]
MPIETDSVLRVCVAGLGGFAAAHHRALRRLEEEGLCRVVAACDPLMDLDEDMAARGIRLYRDLETLLGAESGNLDLLTLPVPVPLHRPMHEMAVRHGVACYLEKPPTLWWPEYLEMLEVEDRAARKTQVGFNFVIDPMRRRLKARILSGEFGKLLGATFVGYWPRHRSYYERASWAGRIRLGDRWVLDNPIGNAMAHYVQNALFMCGGAVDAVAEVEAVRATLQRYRRIESFDTVFLEAQLTGGPWLRIAASHACRGEHRNEETIVMEDAAVRIDTSHTATIVRRDGSKETLAAVWPGTEESLLANLRHYLACLQGQHPRPITTLGDCRGFVSLIDLAFLSVDQIEDRSDGTDPEWVEAPERARELDAFIEKGMGVSEARWAGMERLSGLQAHLESLKAASRPVS